MRRLVIATRGSKLALWQANHIKSRLETRHGSALAVELLVLKTKGDKILDVPLAKVGGKGLFVKEIEDALLDGRAHLAVHSMKDVPVELPEGLVLGIVPPRELVTDCLLSAHWPTLESLPPGAVVGTSSLRRQCQLKALRPDLQLKDLRGNVDTRLGKLLAGEFAAIVMATAGMRRLGLTAPFMQELGPPEFLPAVGQGALGLEFRQGDTDLLEVLGFLDHPPTRITVEAERGFLTGLNGGCQVPIAAHAVLKGKTLRLEGLVADPETGETIRKATEGPAHTAFALGLTLAETVLAAGGREILARVY